MSEIFYNHRGAFIGLLLPLFFLLNAATGGERAEEIRLENIYPVLQDEAVIIAYDLLAPMDKKYEVRLVMRRENDSTFIFFPKTVSGDAGKGKFAGRDRTIRWTYTQDAPAGFAGDDYYFVIAVKKTGSKIWLYRGALGAAVGGAIYLAIPSSQKELPEPPQRP